MIVLNKRNSFLIMAVLVIGCRSASSSEAEQAADYTAQVAISDYFAANGTLPSSDWLTADVQRRAKGELTVRPNWIFSCEQDGYDSSTMVVKVRVEGPNLHNVFVKYHMDVGTYVEGLKHKYK